MHFVLILYHVPCQNKGKLSSEMQICNREWDLILSPTKICLLLIYSNVKEGDFAYTF